MTDLDLTRYQGHTPGHATLQELWSRAVGTPGYVKDDWITLQACMEATKRELLDEVRRLREELDELRDGVEAAGLEFREDDGPAAYWRNTPALDAEHELRALRQSHARLLEAVKADTARRTMPDGRLCWCAGDRYYGEHGFYCADLRAAVAEAEALT